MSLLTRAQGAKSGWDFISDFTWLMMEIMASIGAELTACWRGIIDPASQPHSHAWIIREHCGSIEPTLASRRICGSVTQRPANQILRDTMTTGASPPGRQRERWDPEERRDRPAQRRHSMIPITTELQTRHHPSAEQETVEKNYTPCFLILKSSTKIAQSYRNVDQVSRLWNLLRQDPDADVYR